MSRFVIFDLFHTLVHSPRQVWERAVADVAAINEVAPADLLDAYHQTWRRRQVEWNVEQTIRILAGRLGRSPSPAQVTQAAAVRRDVAGQVLSGVADSTLEVLDRLRAGGFGLGLTSNASAETAEAWPSSGLATRFDAAMFSCEVGAAKPDQRIYLAAMTALGAQPAQCSYIGDGADGELAAAAALGLTVFRTTQHISNDPTWAGRSIATLTELPDLLVR
ncbi:MAG TPA: HAD family hydrolase [Streptosporangiaceae bacterium]|nr:HAD family hydrolase [Streptosporangiaceae bacterium]